MKKKIIGTAFIATMFLAAGWNYLQNQQNTKMTDLAKANIEALASNESGNFDCIKPYTYTCTYDPIKLPGVKYNH